MVSHIHYTLQVLVAGDIRHLYDTDDPVEIEKWDLSTVKTDSPLQRRHSRRAHIRKLTSKRQQKITSPGASANNEPVVGLKRTYSEPVLNRDPPGNFISPAKKFLNTFKSKKS